MGTFPIRRHLPSIEANADPCAFGNPASCGWMAGSNSPSHEAWIPWIQRGVAVRVRSTVALPTEDAAAPFQTFWLGLKPIDLLEVCGFHGVVKIAMRRRRHDGIMAHGHGVAAAVHAAPRLHGRPVGQPAFEDFIPTNHFAPVGFEVPSISPMNHDCNSCASCRPSSAMRFGIWGIAPTALWAPHRLDVDVFRRKKLHRFVQHGFKNANVVSCPAQ